MSILYLHDYLLPLIGLKNNTDPFFNYIAYVVFNTHYNIG